MSNERPIDPEHLHHHAARGQYGEGWIEGERVSGYRSEPDVNPESVTETFDALNLYVDNWRWQDVLFYQRTGKRLQQNISQVIFQFRPVQHQAFPASAHLDWRPHNLAIHIQSEEGNALRFQAKQPRVTLRLSTQEIRFRYAEAFQTAPPEAYETLALLRDWNVSENPWKRRASVVTFVRKVGASGRFTHPALELCENLLGDQEDLVQKGVGWALKDLMRGDKDQVLEYVKSLRRRGIPATITLYAIRDLKGAERQEVLDIKPIN